MEVVTNYNWILKEVICPSGSPYYPTGVPFYLYQLFSSSDEHNSLLLSIKVQPSRDHKERVLRRTLDEIQQMTHSRGIRLRGYMLIGHTDDYSHYRLQAFPE